ncbi:hypothetical protein [Oryzifoliimicrobium ureilyticus]|uniref:hypothetical protein n=1 Tax=Oryzifoliimicrobium ureilyticus TaxID=3113724 RepID=UPI0030760B5F
MTGSIYTAEGLADRYQISHQQALRYIARFGADREELDRLLASSHRADVHRKDELDRTSTDVAVG